MPHRLTEAPFGHIIEGTLMTLGFLWAGVVDYVSVLIDRETMDQLRSADGALFGAAVIVVALWISKIADSKRMDKRHDEMIAVLKSNADKNEKLVVESIKASAKVSHALTMLVSELEDRPCNGGKPLTPINFDTENLS